MAAWHRSRIPPGIALAVAVSYSPAPGFSGTETFQYTVDDGVVVAAVTVTVNVAFLLAAERQRQCHQR